MHFIIFGANYHTLYGLKKFSAQIICRIPQCRFTCHGIPSRMGEWTSMEIIDKYSDIAFRCFRALCKKTNTSFLGEKIALCFIFFRLNSKLQLVSYKYLYLSMAKTMSIISIWSTILRISNDHTFKHRLKSVIFRLISTRVNATYCVFDRKRVTLEKY